MKISICIGAFRFPSFIELSLSRCSKIFPGSPLLVTDDKSPASDEIKVVAEKYGAYYTVGSAPRGHFAGDVQTGINGLSFCEQQGCDIALKLSMRLIPVLPRFRELIEHPFTNPNIQIVVPGRIHQAQIAMAHQRFYGNFGILSDVYAIRRGAITPEAFKAGYEAGFVKGRYSPDNVVECFLGRLLAEKFPGQSYISNELANHKLNEPMAFLRKIQATQLAYEQVAKLDGLSGQYDLREHAMISGKDYLCRPWVEK